MSGRQHCDDLDLGVERMRVPAESRQQEIVTLLNTRDVKGYDRSQVLPRRTRLGLIEAELSDRHGAGILHASEACAPRTAPPKACANLHGFVLAEVGFRI